MRQGYRRYCQEGDRELGSINESVLNQTVLYEKEKEIVTWLMSEDNSRLSRELQGQAIRFIEESYMGVCGLAEVAAHVHLNPSYFSNLFKKETGESVTGYIQNLRVQKEKLLLKSTDMKIFEISEATGFNDSIYFTHMFNKVAGVSPKEYRKQMAGQDSYR